VGCKTLTRPGSTNRGQANGPPHDNNDANLHNLADWKAAAARDWASKGLPLILDVSNGMDGRFVWKREGSGFWGDNLEYTDDRWRNWMSELKGPHITGITFDTWNGYTEGYAAVPSFEHYYSVANWLSDLFKPDPRDFSHMHYVNGVATHRVYGAICEKWIALGADRGFGVPTSDEERAGRGRVSFFTDNPAAPYDANKAIYWGPNTDAHEVHGIIARTYWNETDTARLGLPIADEKPNGDGRVSRFEHGRIDWISGETVGRVTYLS
jgi:LGFP repeat